MNFTKSIAALLLVTSALTACKSGGAREDDFVSKPPIDNASFAVIEEKTDVRDGESKLFAHAAVVVNSTAAHRIGKFTIASSKLDEDDNFTPAQVRSEFDTSGDGAFKSEHVNDPAYAQDAVQIRQTREENEGDFAGTIMVGNQEALVNVDYPYEPNVDQAYIVYVPRNADSEMYAGAIVDHNMGGHHGVFGRQTTTNEMSQQNSSATYSGIAMASVQRYNPQDLSQESGLYEGDASATVNFENRNISMNSTLTKDRRNSTGTDTVVYSSNGTFDANGNIAGNAAYTGLPGASGTLTGTTEGSFFGPNAETIGATFAGAHGTYGGEDANAQIAGHTILNRD